MESILEILRSIFPILIADKIFYFFILNYNKQLSSEFLLKLKFNGMQKILNFKNSIPAYWLINFEKIQREEYSNTSKNLNLFYKSRKKILIDNHNFLKKWRERQYKKSIMSIKFKKS